MQCEICYSIDERRTALILSRLYGYPSIPRRPFLVAKRQASPLPSGLQQRAPVIELGAPSQPSEIVYQVKRTRTMSDSHPTSSQPKYLHDHVNTIVNALLAGARRIRNADANSWQIGVKRVKSNGEDDKAVGAPLTTQELNEACDRLMASPTTAELDRNLESCIEGAQWTIRLATLVRCFVEKTRIYLHERSKSNAYSKMYRSSANERRQFACLADVIIALSNAMVRSFGSKAFLVCALLTGKQESSHVTEQRSDE